MIKDRSRLFPQPTYPVIPKLVFERRITPDERCPSYMLGPRAEFHATCDGRRVLVKFSEKYHPDAHYVVADMGLAPKLHFHAQLRGGVHMAVMDAIDASDAHCEFGQGELPDEVVKQVKVALHALHQKNLVHGNVRRTSILVRKGRGATSPGPEAVMDVDMPWQVYLVEFDRVGEANDPGHRYTPFLNMAIPWPAGVRPGGLMQVVHDDMMLEKIIRTGSCISPRPFLSRGIFMRSTDLDT